MLQSTNAHAGLDRRAAIVGIGLALAAPWARAAYPDRAIRILVPFSPGASDLQIRALVPLLSARMGQPVVVENLAGGGGSIAANRARSATADGQTLLFTGTAALTMLPSLNSETTYRLDDFMPIAMVSTLTGVLVVRPGMPYKNIAEFLAYAKANPDKLNFASSGVGTAGHTMGAGLQVFGGFSMTHIPYKGGGEMVNALLSGTADVGCLLPAVAMAHIQAGALVPLAVTATTRSEFLPNVPTYREAGIGYADGESYGLLGPKGVPPSTVERISRAVQEAVQEPAYRETMRKSFTSLQYLNAPAYRTVLQDRLQGGSSCWPTRDF